MKLSIFISKQIGAPLWTTANTTFSFKESGYMEIGPFISVRNFSHIPSDCFVLPTPKKDIMVGPEPRINRRQNLG